MSYGELYGQKLSNSTKVKCGFTMNAHSSQNLNLILLGSFFADQLNQNRFDPLANDSGTKAPQTGSDKDKFISGLKFVSININSIKGKKLEL